MAFDFDGSAGGAGGGEPGPYISWGAKGSAEKGLPPRSFIIRDRIADDGPWEETAFEGFKKGVALNLTSVKQGWKNGDTNDRQWGVDLKKRPDESKRDGGGFAWSIMFGARVAIGGGKSAWWEDSSWGGYEGFKRLAQRIDAAIQEKPSRADLAPVVILTDTEKKEFKRGNTHVPILEVKDWVARPDCFETPDPVGFSDDAGGDDESGDF